MCRSSRIVCFSLMLQVGIASSPAMARPAASMPHGAPLTIGRGLTPAATGGASGALAGHAAQQARQARQVSNFARNGGLAQTRFGQTGFARTGWTPGARGRHRGRFDGGYAGIGADGLGYDGLGYGGLVSDGPGSGGFDAAGVALAPAGGPAFHDPGGDPFVIRAPTPCLPPRIIRIGRGLQHPATTRVVYGAPPCGF